MDYSSLEQTDAQLEVELDKVKKMKRSGPKVAFFVKFNLVF